MEKEIWKIIEDNPNYMISNMGRVKSLKFGKEKILKPSMKSNGYYSVGLRKEGKIKTFSVHRLVAQAFLDNPNNLPQVNHKDENPKNNNVSNLEWCTQKYNINYGTRLERMGKAHQKPIVQIHKSGLIIDVWDSIIKVERELGIDNYSITRCCKGKCKSTGGFKWKYLNELKKAG